MSKVKGYFRQQRLEIDDFIICAMAAGTLTDKPRGPKPNPDRAAMRRLEAENARLTRKLADAEAIIEAQKKLTALLDRLKTENGR